MFIRCSLSVAFLVAFALPSFAQTAWQFNWQKGRALTYKIKHVTAVTEVLENTKNSSHSNLDVINRWQVTDLDNKGVATLTLTLVAMRNEQKRAKGDTLLFDSNNLDKSTPELREQMGKYIGKVVAALRVDQYGRVIDVKQGSAASYEAEPPFLVVFPEAKAAAGQAWRRPFNLVMEPPYGTGEKFQGEQRYECKKIDFGKATLAVATQFKTQPENLRDRLPLLQKELQGEMVFDLETGRLLSAQMTIDKTIDNHQGKGSSYHFKSEYSRVLVD